MHKIILHKFDLHYFENHWTDHGNLANTLLLI